MMALLLAFIIGWGLGAGFGYVILEPATAALRGRWTTNFHVADFFPLSLLVSVPLVFVGTMRRYRGEDSPLATLLSVLLVAVFAYIWWRGTVVLSGIGVKDTRRRWVFLGVLIPVAVCGAAIGLPVLVAMAFAIPRLPRPAMTGWLLSILAVPAIAWWGRRVTRWVLAGTDDWQDDLPLGNQVG